MERAENKDPKLKMSMTFRWYLSKSAAGQTVAVRPQMDYQIWCGPAIGSFNEYIKDTYLDVRKSSVFPCVVQINLQLLRGACYLQRIKQIDTHPLLDCDVTNISQYVPDKDLIFF